MVGYKITQSQKEELKGKKMDENAYFNPVQDANGDWFIFETEHQSCGYGIQEEFIINN